MSSIMSSIKIILFSLLITTQALPALPALPAKRVHQSEHYYYPGSTQRLPEVYPPKGKGLGYLDEIFINEWTDFDTRTIDGIWISSACMEDHSAESYIQIYGIERFRKEIQQSADDAFRGNRLETKAFNECDKADKWACLSWSHAVDFEVTPTVSDFIVERGVWCNKHGQGSISHLVPNDSEWRLNVCVGDSPSCQNPMATKVPGCGMNVNDVNGTKIDC